MKILSLFTVWGVLLSFAGTSYAGRPLSTEDAGVTEKGSFQLEVSYEYAGQKMEIKSL